MIYSLLKFLLCSIISFSLPPGKPISEIKLRQLKNQFSRGRAISTDFIKSHENKLWSCTLFGVRSRIQKEKKTRLYQFKLSHVSQGTIKINNLGTQMTKNYHLKDGILRASTEKFEDLVKMTAENKLIAQFSSRRSITSDPVLTYALCQ